MKMKLLKIGLIYKIDCTPHLRPVIAEKNENSNCEPPKKTNVYKLWEASRMLSIIDLFLISLILKQHEDENREQRNS